MNTYRVDGGRAGPHRHRAGGGGLVSARADPPARRPHHRRPARRGPVPARSGSTPHEAAARSPPARSWSTSGRPPSAPREGEVPGALIVERNVLEWRFDPASDAPAARGDRLRRRRDRALLGGLHVQPRGRRAARRWACTGPPTSSAASGPGPPPGCRRSAGTGPVKDHPAPAPASRLPAPCEGRPARRRRRAGARGGTQAAGPMAGRRRGAARRVHRRPGGRRHAVRVDCANTTSLVLTAPAGGPGPAPLTAFTAAARAPHRTAVLLVRRGRWAVGVSTARSSWSPRSTPARCRAAPPPVGGPSSGSPGGAATRPTPSSPMPSTPPRGCSGRTRPAPTRWPPAGTGASSPRSWPTRGCGRWPRCPVGPLESGSPPRRSC